MNRGNRFASVVFYGAGIYGVLGLAPLYFLEQTLARMYPPALTHPEHFYGFLGVALAWQIAFFVIAGDVHRFRPLMLPAMLEKLSFGAAALVLYTQGRVPTAVLATGVVDLVLMVLFAVAYRVTPASPSA